MWQAAKGQSRLRSGVVTRYVEDITIVRQPSTGVDSDEASVSQELRVRDGKLVMFTFVRIHDVTLSVDPYVENMCV